MKKVYLVFKKILLLQLLPLLLLISGCGDVDVNHDHTGDVTHTVNIDIENLEDYFLELCEQDADCARELTLNFLKFLTEKENI